VMAAMPGGTGQPAAIIKMLPGSVGQLGRAGDDDILTHRVGQARVVNLRRALHVVTRDAQDPDQLIGNRACAENAHHPEPRCGGRDIAGGAFDDEAPGGETADSRIEPLRVASVLRCDRVTDLPCQQPFKLGAELSGDTEAFGRVVRAGQSPLAVRTSVEMVARDKTYSVEPYLREGRCLLTGHAVLPCS